MSKSQELIPLIIEANDKEKAIQVLYKTLEMLHLSTDYAEMVRLRDRLVFFQGEYKKLTQNINVEGVVMEYEQLNHIRLALDFLFRDIQDELSAPINSNKVFYEEIKTVRRAEAYKELFGSETADNYKAKSLSAIGDIIGESKRYAEYAAEKAIAYGNYKTLENLLVSIKNMTNSIASREKRELIIIQKDAK